MLVYSSLTTSVWILVAFTIERVISVFLPHGVRFYCSRSRSVVVVCGIVVAVVTVNSHFLYGYSFANIRGADSEEQTLIPVVAVHARGRGTLVRSLSSGSSSNISGNHTEDLSTCLNDMEVGDYDRFLSNVWPWIDFSLFSVIPGIIIITSNICITARIIKHRKQMLAKNIRMISATILVGIRVLHLQETRNSTEVSIPPENLRVKSNGSMAMPSNSICSSRNKKDRDSSMTTILVVLNVMFLVTTTPAGIFFIYDRYWHDALRSRRDEALYNLTYTVVNLIMYINNAFNFLMYSVTGSRFRQEVRNIMCPEPARPKCACQKMFCRKIVCHKRLVRVSPERINHSENVIETEDM